MSDGDKASSQKSKDVERGCWLPSSMKGEVPAVVCEGIPLSQELSCPRGDRSPTIEGGAEAA